LSHLFAIVQDNEASATRSLEYLQAPARPRQLRAGQQRRIYLAQPAARG